MRASRGEGRWGSCPVPAGKGQEPGEPDTAPSSTDQNPAAQHMGPKEPEEQKLAFVPESPFSVCRPFKKYHMARPAWLSG